MVSGFKDQRDQSDGTLQTSTLTSGRLSRFGNAADAGQRDDPAPDPGHGCADRPAGVRVVWLGEEEIKIVEGR